MALRLRHTSDQHPDARWPRDGADYVVMSGEVAVGRIMRLQDGPQDGNWMWSVTGLVHNDGPLHGRGHVAERCAGHVRRRMARLACQGGLGRGRAAYAVSCISGQ